LANAGLRGRDSGVRKSLLPERINSIAVPSQEVAPPMMHFIIMAW
jgi:hypothetical protein